MKFNTSSIKMSNSDILKKIILPQKVDNNLAEEIGWHVGDGSMNFYSGKGLYQLRGHLIDDKQHYLNHITSVYKKLYNLELNIREMPSTGVIGFQIWSDVLVDFKNKILGLPLGKKKDIQIPYFILQNKDFLFSFARGLFDTDGCFYVENKRGKPYPRIEIKTTLKTASFQLHKHLNKLGFCFTIYKHTRKEKNWADLFALVLRGNKQCEQWMKLIGTNNPKNKKKINAWWQSSGN